MIPRLGYGLCVVVLLAVLSGCGAARRVLGGQPQRGPSVVGTIQTIDGATITIQPSAGGAPATVQISDSTMIRKEVAQTISDVKPGMDLLAVGQQNGDTFEARQIQIRPQGAPQGRGGGNGTRVVGGTVDNVSGDTITVNTTSGSTVQVRLASNGRILQQTNGSPSDLRQGEYLLATGQKQGDTLVASSVILSDTPLGGGPNAAG